MDPADQATPHDQFLADASAILRPHLLREQADSPLPPLSLQDARDSLPIALPERGVGEPEALARLARLVAATPATSGPRFVNQLFAGRDRVATAAEVVTAALNTSMYTYKAAGPQVLVEKEVLHRLLSLARMPDGDGMFTPGGSLSNLAAMIVGRNEVTATARDDGFDGRRRTLYVSAESHYSIRKNANIIGIGRDAVRPVKADDAGRMVPADLARRIERDRADGLEPMMVVATSGTTVMGAFDPIEPIADVAESEGLWLHVDGAFGGTALLHPSTRPLLDGLERADSFTWDPHKSMGVPLTCSVALTRRPGLMRTHFDEHASYLFQQDFDAEQSWLNPGVKSLQCGRRNDALKLWAQWQALGDDGYARRVARQLELAAVAARIARTDDRFILACEPQWLTICFEVAGKPSAEICDALESSGVLKVGYGVVNSRRVVRLVTANPSHTPADIERMMHDIAAVAETLPDADNHVDPAAAEPSRPSAAGTMSPCAQRNSDHSPS